MKSKKFQKKEELIKRAYVLGYEVGYYGHYESVGWVKKELRKIEELAREEGIEKEVLTAYRKGKLDSQRKRSYELTEGKEIPADEISNVRAERTIIRALRRQDRRITFINLPKFLRRRNHF